MWRIDLFIFPENIEAATTHRLADGSGAGCSFGSYGVAMLLGEAIPRFFRRSLRP